MSKLLLLFLNICNVICNIYFKNNCIFINNSVYCDSPFLFGKEKIPIILLSNNTFIYNGTILNI